MKKQTNLPAGGRKLNLNKKTIANLNTTEMNALVGGDKTKGHNCFTNANLCTHSCTTGIGF